MAGLASSSRVVCIAVTSWCLHSLFLNKLLTPVRFIQFVRQSLGLGHVEFFEGDLCDDILTVNAQQIEEWIAACKEFSIEIYAISAKNDLTLDSSSDPKMAEAVARDVARLKRWIELAPRLGIKVLRINTGLRRPSRESYERLKLQLLELLPIASANGVLLVIENHPHPFYGPTDVELFAEFGRSTYENGLRLCPDTGSFDKTFNLDSIIRTIDRLSPHAGHFHFKVPDKHDHVEQIEHFYRPFVESLSRQDYSGGITVEYVETPLSPHDPVTATWRAVRALANLLGADVERTEPTLSDLAVSFSTSGKPPEIPATIRLDEGILPLVVEGCRYRIQARTKLQTFFFDSGNNYPSHDWGHRCGTMAASCEPSDVGTVPSNLCAIISQDFKAEEACERFYKATFDEIRTTGKLRRPICQCPLGLTLMFEPVATESRLFGAMACGGWREAGLEGAIFYGINEHVQSDEVRQRAEEAISEIKEFGPNELQRAHETMRSVT